MLELEIADEKAILPEAAEGEVEVWREEGQVCAYGYQAAGYNWLHVPGAATFRFLRAGEPVVAIPIGSPDDGVLRDAFERTALPLALQSLGRQVLHASAVHGPAGVIAFCGDSGTGKSTLAFGASRRGYRLWADDAVAFYVIGDRVVALPLPFRILLRPDSAAFYGVGQGDVDALGHTPDGPAPLAAVVILERSDERGPGVALERLARADAFPAALAQGYCYRPTDAEQSSRMVEDYLELAARVPVFVARFAPRFGSVDALLDRIEDELHPRA